MLTRFLISLQYFRLDGVHEDFPIDDLILAQNQTDSLRGWLFSEELIKIAGTTFIEWFTKYPYLYSIEDVNSLEQVPPKCEYYQSKINTLLSLLWFIKDNSANLFSLIGYIPEANHQVFHRSPKSAYSNSSGSYSDQSFTIEEIEKVARISQSIAKYSRPRTSVQRPPWDGTPSISDTKFHYLLYNENNRIEKALNFLNMARSNSFLPLKIALYFSVFEAIFTTDDAGLSHKIAERASLYLGGGFEEKIDNFKKIRKAYDIRSKFYHGQNLSNKHDTRDKLVPISNYL
ncbi:MAG: hypothetical protein EOP48_26235, partial [Sphingobacteriales bacterium]